MTTFTFPTIRGTRVRRTLASAAAATTSPFTGTQQIQDWDGEWWEATIDLEIKTGAEGRALSAFFAKLKGIVNTFLIVDPSICQSENYGSPLVDGADQAGNTLVTDGWSAIGLQTGDFFSIGAGEDTRIYQLTADVVPAAGVATLEFVPALRSSPADNEAIEVNNPQILLRATSPVPADIRGSRVYQFSFTAREAI